MITIDSYSSKGGKPENEDTCAFCNYEKNLVFVLADGLGGHGDGKRASEIACEELMKCGSDNRKVKKDDIVEAFDKANAMILAQHENEYHMKTTAVYLCISEANAIWGYLGDSRLYHFYNGQLEHFTLDHSIAQLAVYMGEISRDEIAKYPGRSKIFHALGTEGEELSAVTSIDLEPGQHAFFLCSDGVWELLSDQLIQQQLIQSASAQEWIQKIRTIVEDTMPEGHDNHTAIAVIMNR